MASQRGCEVEITRAPCLKSCMVTLCIRDRHLRDNEYRQSVADISAPLWRREWPCQTQPNIYVLCWWQLSLFLHPTMPRILFVSGFHPQTRAKDLAHEFEQYVFPPTCVFFCSQFPSFGPLVRCDVPAPRVSRAAANP